MIDRLNMPSAKVYQFVARKREASPARSAGAAIVTLRPLPAPLIQWGASYHEEAIAEAARSNRN